MRLLYLPCHARLESQEYKTFTDLGFTVQSSGFYCNPAKPTKDFLNPQSFTVDKDLHDEFRKLNPDYTYGYDVPLVLTKSFIDKFDVIVVSWRFDYFEKYKDLFLGKVVVFCTVGQSDLNRENQLKKAREQGLNIVRIMPAESRYPGFAGADKFVSGWVDYDETNQWTGENEHILTIKASLQQRARATNANEYLQVTSPFAKKLYGYGNEGLAFCEGTIEEEDMIQAYRKARLSFGLGSKPAPIVYTTLEAMARGCPLVTWGPKLGNFPGMSTYCMHEYINNGINGFYSDSIPELQNYCSMLLNDLDMAREVGEAGRQLVKDKFSYEVVKNNWKEFFEHIGVL